MDFSYTIDREDRVAILRVHGVVELDALHQVLNRVFDDRHWQLDYGLMIVYEKDALLGEITLEDLKVFQRKSRARQDLAPAGTHIRSALVYTREDQRVLLQLHQMSFAENRIMEEAVFGSKADALHWLKSDKNEIRSDTEGTAATRLTR